MRRHTWASLAASTRGYDVVSGRRRDSSAYSGTPHNVGYAVDRITFVLEFLDLKDEYSESELEDALVRDLETFLLELGSDFAFVGRQRRLRLGNTWYRIDLLFFHRRLRCLVIIDLKLGEFGHADAGQMHLYLNYAKEHWTVPGENPPVGLILCSAKDEAVVKYALAGHASKVLAAEYRTALPTEAVLAEHIEAARSTLARMTAATPRPGSKARRGR